MVDVKLSIDDYSLFENTHEIPWDPIIEIMEVYRKCEDKTKVNLTVGAYRDENLKPFVFTSVKKAEERIFSSNFSRAYLPSTGDNEFNKLCQSTLFDENHEVMKNKRILTVQGLSGTGGLRLATEFLFKFVSQKMILQEPSWPNHLVMFDHLGYETTITSSYDLNTNKLPINEFLGVLSKAQEKSIVLLQACGHNPTGTDPTKDQWKQIAEVMKKNKLFPLFDMAYQGFVTGDLAEDAYPIYLFLEMGFEMFIAQSFSKSMGLYGERAGPLHMIVNDPNAIPNIESQLNKIALNDYLVPVGHGARIIKTVLGDKELCELWKIELKQVVGRLSDMRTLLYNKLIEIKCPGDWEHLKEQKGMFSYTGLTEKHCDVLINKHKIFLVKSGRISLSGIIPSNVERIALAIKDAIETSK